MGPSVKFVHASMVHFPKKSWVDCFLEKDQGGDPSGVWQNTTLFPIFFFGTPPLSICYNTSP